MQKIVGDRGPLSCRITLDLKDGFLFFGQDLDQFVVETRIYAIALDHPVQDGCVFLDSIDRSQAGPINDLRSASQSLLPEIIGSQIPDLLWRSGAFRGRARHVKQGRPTSKVTDQVPGFRRQVIRVVARSVSSKDGIFETGDGVPVQLSADRNDEEVIA